MSGAGCSVRGVRPDASVPSIRSRTISVLPSRPRPTGAPCGMLLARTQDSGGPPQRGPSHTSVSGTGGGLFDVPHARLLPALAVAPRSRATPMTSTTAPVISRPTAIQSSTASSGRSSSGRSATTRASGAGAIAATTVFVAKYCGTRRRRPSRLFPSHGRTDDQRAAIERAAEHLVKLRDRWLKSNEPTPRNRGNISMSTKAGQLHRALLTGPSR